MKDTPKNRNDLLNAVAALSTVAPSILVEDEDFMTKMDIMLWGRATWAMCIEVLAAHVAENY